MNDVDFKLRIFKRDYTNNHVAWNHLRFAVVDLHKSEEYPSNFVSMLPMRIDSDEDAEYFHEVFRNQKSRDCQKTIDGIFEDRK
jgi:hypothetical protein